MNKCRWYHNGGIFEDKEHTFERGVCRLCGVVEALYKEDTKTCVYCGRESYGNTCYRCSRELDREATLFAQRRIA